MQGRARKSIITKFILFVLVIVLISSFVSGYNIYIRSKNKELSMIYDDLATRILTFKDSLVKTKDIPLKDKIKFISDVPYIADELISGKDINTVNYLKKIMDESPEISAIAIVDSNYKPFSMVSKIKGSMPDFGEFFIDIDTLKKGNSYVEPYLTKDFPYFVYYSPIFKGNKVIGVAAMFINGHGFMSPLNIVYTRHKYHEPQVVCASCHVGNNSLDERGFPVLFDKDGVLLLSPIFGDKSIVGEEKQLKEVYDQIKDKFNQSDKYDGEIVYKGKTYIGSFSKFEVNRLIMLVGMLKNKNYVLKTIEEGLLLSIGFTVILVLVIILVGFVYLRNMMRPVKSLSETMVKVMDGEYSVRVNVTSDDEFGQLGEGFNEMLNRLTKFLQTQEDIDRMQKQVISLMDVVSKAADGDLTVEAEVTADELGSVADAFNLMTENMRSLINDIKNAGGSIVEATEKLLLSAEQTSKGAQFQIEELKDVDDKIERFKEISIQLNEAAKKTVDIIKDASITASKSLELLDNTIDSMFNVKRYSQMASKKVKSLGEKSLAIGDITSVITEISNQTNMLALNATIEAARAGEYGHGFSVVADEIRKLAERSNKATKEIADLIKSIQNETAETVKLVEESTVNIESSSGIIERTGDAIKDINNVLISSSEAVKNMADSVEMQSEEVIRVSQSMKKIREISEKTVDDVKNTNRIVATLSQLSEMFKEAVDKFRV
ncbi:MAG: methyl-accepting chemotaxis protein [Calditerrivibrio sp.]|nr:methyl-accepting chemotaxis protein [Calditerrivibrio sp.]